MTKKLWDYIKKNNLQDTKKRTLINADDASKAVFGGKKQVSMFEITKFVSKHVKIATLYCLGGSETGRRRCFSERTLGRNEREAWTVTLLSVVEDRDGSIFFLAAKGESVPRTPILEIGNTNLFETEGELRGRKPHPAREGCDAHALADMLAQGLELTDDHLGRGFRDQVAIAMAVKRRFLPSIQSSFVCLQRKFTITEWSASNNDTTAICFFHCFFERAIAHHRVINLF